MSHADSTRIVAPSERIRPQAITFDFYGTLMDNKQEALRRFEQILRWNGAATTDLRAFHSRWVRVLSDLQLGPYRRYREICQMALERTFHDFGISGRPQDIEHYFEGFSKFVPWPETESVLQRLSQHYPLGIVTNCDNDLFWSTPHPDVPFRYFFTSESARGYKADGTLFRYALREIGLKGEDLLQAGQSQRTDLIGAKPLGILCAWINRHSLARDSDVPVADFEFKDLTPLLEVVEMNSSTSLAHGLEGVGA